MVSKKRLKQALTKERIILGGRVIPLFVTLLITGVFLFWIVFLGNLWPGYVMSHDSPWKFEIPPLSLAAAVAGIYLPGFWINRLTLELPTRTYVQEHGVYPFLKRRGGSLADFDHLGFSREMKQGSHPNSVYYVWCLELAWKADLQSTAEAPTYGVYGSGDRWDRLEMLRVTENLAHKIGIQVIVKPDQ